MCGIAGSLRSEPGGEGAVQSILSDQHRRGPDAQKLLTRNGLVFGHNRLAILDLDPRSNQPFLDEDSNNLLVYNGEVYNFVELKSELESKSHRFKTTSDTEVILKAYQEWGLKAFERFNGMFALALHDKQKDQTVLVRDRFGVKPLYYHLNDGVLTFASNAKALARAVSAKVNWDYLNLGLAFDLYEGLTTETGFHGVQSLPPGQLLIFERGKHRLERFYDLRARVDAIRADLAGFSEAELVSTLRSLLLSAVEFRLRSDVPVTLSLSGGLDSGICAALMRETREEPFDVFTFANPEMQGSEAGLAALTAKHLGLTLNYSELVAGDVPSIFEATLDAQSLPFAHPTVMAQNTVFRGIKKGGYKVSIGGQGADEAFAGYRKFQLFYLKELLRKGNLPAFLVQGAGVARTLARELGSPQRYFYYLTRFQRSENATLTFSRGALAKPPARSATTLSERQILDVEALSLPTLLRYEDSNSMFYSIESRMPFLDYRVVEFGLALPAKYKVRGGFGKYLLRKVAEPMLPAEIIWDRNKRAFSLDQGWWMANGLAAILRAQVENPVVQGLVTPEFYKKLEDPKFYLDPNNFTKLTSLAWLMRNREFWE